MEEVFPDWYAILGVAPDATPTEIRKAFRAGARQFHPDVNKSPDATAHFIELQKAYEVLSSPERRAAYDGASRLRRRKTTDQSNSGGRQNDTLWKESPGAEPVALYIIMDFEPGHSAHFLFRSTLYNLSADEVARLQRDGMLRGRFPDQSEYLLLYCVHCHALFTKRSRKSVPGSLDLPYDLFPLCPHCQAIDWCPANDVIERHEAEDRAIREQAAREAEAIREQAAHERLKVFQELEHQRVESQLTEAQVRQQRMEDVFCVEDLENASFRRRQKARDLLSIIVLGLILFLAMLLVIFGCLLLTNPSSLGFLFLFTGLAIFVFLLRSWRQKQIAERRYIYRRYSERRD